MNIVDSCGWLEYFADDTNASFFSPIITNTKKLIVPSITITEVFKKIIQQKDEDLALQAISVMHQGTIVDLTSAIAVTAAQLGALHKLPLADSIIYSTAKHNKATIYTQDADFKDLDMVKYIAKVYK